MEERDNGLPHLDPLDQKKDETLMKIWTLLTEELFKAEALETKTTFAVSALLILFPAFMAKESVKLTATSTGLLAALFVSITVITILVLLRNADRIRWLCQVIVRIEVAIGMYDPGVYTPSEKLVEHLSVELDDSALFPQEGKSWGKKDKNLVLRPKIIAIVFCCFLSILLLLGKYSLLDNPKNQEQRKEPKSNKPATLHRHAPSSSLKACFMSNTFLNHLHIYPYGFHPSHLFAVKAA